MPKIQNTYLLFENVTIDSTARAHSAVLDARRFDFSQNVAYQYKFADSTSGTYCICSLNLLVTMTSPTETVTTSNSGGYLFSKDSGLTAKQYLGRLDSNANFIVTKMNTIAPYIVLQIKNVTDNSLTIEKFWFTVNEEL